MYKRFFIATTVSVLSFFNVKASSNDSLIIGTWKGTSICQVKSSPCHDEVVVCYMTRGDKPGTYLMDMYKVVNGAEQDMGVLEYTFNASENSLTCADEPRKAVWRFKVNGKVMEGTLYYKGQLFRIVKMKKEK